LSTKQINKLIFSLMFITYIEYTEKKEEKTMRKRKGEGINNRSLSGTTVAAATVATEKKQKAEQEEEKPWYVCLPGHLLATPKTRPECRQEHDDEKKRRLAGKAGRRWATKSQCEEECRHREPVPFASPPMPYLTPTTKTFLYPGTTASSSCTSNKNSDRCCCHPCGLGTACFEFFGSQ
jgi:hypothetical protein